MVEMAGVEPASSKSHVVGSTCLVIFLHLRRSITNLNSDEPVFNLNQIKRID